MRISVTFGSNISDARVKGQKAVHACMIRLLNLGPPNMECDLRSKSADFECLPGGSCFAAGNSVGISRGGKIPFAPCDTTCERGNYVNETAFNQAWLPACDSRLCHRHWKRLAFSVRGKDRTVAAFVILYLIFLLCMGFGADDGAGRRKKPPQSAVLGYKALEKPGSKWHIHGGWFCIFGCYTHDVLRRFPVGC